MNEVPLGHSQVVGLTPAPQGLLSEFKNLSKRFPLNLSLDGEKLLPSGQLQVVGGFLSLQGFLPVLRK